MVHSSGNAVAVVYDLLAQLLKPSLEVLKEWGELNKTAMGLDIKRDFEGDFESFVDFLQSNFPVII